MCRKNMMQGGCKTRFKKSYFTLCSSQTVRLNHRRMFHPNILCSVFLPSRDNTEYRTKSSPLTFPLKPLQSSSTRVSHLLSSSSWQRRSDPLQHTVRPHSRSCYIKLISCDNSQLGSNKCTVNQIRQTWQTWLHTSQIFTQISWYSFSLLIFAPQKYHRTVSWEWMPLR